MKATVLKSGPFLYFCSYFARDKLVITFNSVDEILRGKAVAKRRMTVNDSS